MTNDVTLFKLVEIETPSPIERVIWDAAMKTQRAQTVCDVIGDLKHKRNLAHRRSSTHALWSIVAEVLDSIVGQYEKDAYNLGIEQTKRLPSP